LSSDLGPGEIYSIGVDAPASNTFYRSYFLTVDSQRSRHMYVDEACLTELAPVDGVYVFRTEPPNISGSLVQPNGAPFTLAEGVRAAVSLFTVFEDGYQSSLIYVTQNGNFTGLLNPNPGHYFAQVMFSGSDNRPGFKTSAFWVNSAGLFSETENGTYVPQSEFRIRLVVSTTAPNVILHTVVSGTNAADPAYIWVYDQADWVQIGPGATPSGIASLILQDGVYEVSIQPFDRSRLSRSFTLRVANGISSIADKQGQAVTPQGGVFNLSGSDANLTIRAIDPDTNQPLLGVWASVYRDGDGYEVANPSVVNGLIHLSLPNAEDLKAEICADEQSAKFSCQTYDLVKTPEGASLTLGDEITNASGGFLDLVLKKNNLRIKMVSPTDQATALSNSYASVYKVTSNGKNTYIGSSNNGLGYGGALLVDGDYILNVSPGESNPGVAAQKYKVRVTNSIPSVTTMGDVAVPVSDGMFTTALALPNFKVKLVDPTDPLTALRSADVSLMRQTSTGWTWVNDFWLNNSELGLNLEVGTYRLVITPNYSSQGLSEKTYTVVVNGNDVEVRDDANNSVATANGYFHLTASLPNLTGRLVDSDGNRVVRSDNSWVKLQLEKLYGGSKWSAANSNPRFDNSTGSFSARIREAGTYRIKATPYGYTNVATTVTPSFTVSADELATFSKSFGDLQMAKPLLKVQIRTATGTSNLQNVSFQVLKDGQYLVNEYIGETGTGVLSVDTPGTYQLRLHPGDLAATSISKTYNMTVVQRSDGSLVASVDGVVADSTGTVVLRLGAPTLSGRVLATDGLTPVSYATITPVDVATNRERWDLNVTTDRLGRWAIKLPAGQFRLYANSQKSGATFGPSEPSRLVLVDSSGVATLAAEETRTANSFDLQLSPPTWSGVVQDPTGTSLVANARVCLVAQVDKGWICATTDLNGAWSISKPFGFAGFDAQSELIVTPNNSRLYSEKRIKGAAAVSAVLGDYSQAITNKNVALRVAAPNLEITVTANGQPVANRWVQLDRPETGYFASASTDELGKVRFNVSDPTGALIVQVNANDLLGFANTVKRISSGVLSTGQDGVVRVNVPLAVPNFHAVLTEPGAPNKPIPNASVDAYNETKETWAGARSTDSTGQVDLYLSPPTSGADVYRINVRSPEYKTTSGTLLYDNQYTAIVTSSGGIILTENESSVSVSASEISGKTGSFYSLNLLKPSVTGVVTQPDQTTPVDGSWVYVSQQNGYKWFGPNSSQSKEDGSFGIPLKDGDYEMYANAPGNSTALERSKTCSVAILNGVVTSPDSECVSPNKSVKLNLRDTNLSFTLKNPDTGLPVPGAYVYLRIGAWSAQGRSDNLGRVRMLVDVNEILDKNVNNSRQIWTWLSVNAPYDQSGVVSFSCQTGTTKRICAQFAPLLGFDTSTADSFVGASPWDLGDLNFQTPNTTVRAVLPNGDSVGAGAWANLSKNSPYCSQCRWSIGSAQLDSNGEAVFFVEEEDIANGTFTVEVNAPWQLRSSYSQKTYSGLTYSQVNDQSFALATPNLKVNVNQAAPGAVASRWSRLELRKEDAQNPGTFNWANGGHTDETGTGYLTLDPSSKYQVILHPGPRSLGTVTTCVVTTDANGVASIDTTDCSANPTTVSPGSPGASLSVSMKLARGNVQGIITHNGVGFEGAVVIAEPVGLSTAAPGVRKVQIVTTDEAGEYGLQLEAGVTWQMTVISVMPDKMGTKVDSPVTPGGSTVIQRNLEIAAP
jgi:hypothetical protein